MKQMQIRLFHLAVARRRSGLTLIELLVVLIIGLILVGFLISSVIKARQRGLVAALTQDGARTTYNEDRSVRMLDISQLPPDKLGDNLDRMARLKNLYALNLDHAAITASELEPLLAEMDLVQLHLVGTDITDKAAEIITRQNRLEVLDVRATFIGDQGVQQLAALTGLHNLRLSETWITDTALEHLVSLPQLQILDLRGTDISDAGLTSLRQFPALQTVRLTGTRVTMDAAAALKRDRPNLRVEFRDSWSNRERVGLRFLLNPLQFEAKRLLNGPHTDETLRRLARLRSHHCTLNEQSSVNAMQHLGRVRNLSSLRLEGQWVSDDALASLWRNHRLAALYLTNAPVTDACLPHIARCRSIAALKLSGNEFTGNGLGRLRACRSLQSLNLSGLTLTEAAFDQLATLDTLRELDLTDTGADEAQLAKLVDLDLVRLNYGGRRYSGKQVRRFLDSLSNDARNGSAP